MCEPKKRPRRKRATPGRLVLIKEDRDSFYVRLTALLEEVLASRETCTGIEIAAGDRASFYLPRIRGVL